jgi:glycosyltransferase involved in cell wall biosynthesis
MSVRAQEDERYHHVVVDDASPDGAWSMIHWCEKNHPRFTGVRLQKNAGLAGAFHAGVAALPADCDWLLKCDADDKIDARYVAEILKAAAEDPRRNVIFSPCQHFGTRHDVFTYPEPFQPEKMQRVFYIPGPAAFRRSLWDAVGGYDVTMRSAEDWDFYIRAELAVGLVPHQLPRPRWYYRMHDGPRASHEGMRQLEQLQRYWRGHTRETLGKRTWGAWLAEQRAAGAAA